MNGGGETLHGDRVPQPVRFVVTGVLNTLFGYAVFAGLVLAGMPAPAALLAATVVGVLFNFFSFGRLTFRRPELHRLPRFLLAYAALYLLNLGLLVAVGKLFGLGPLPGQVLCLLVVAPTAYWLLKSKVFED